MWQSLSWSLSKPLHHGTLGRAAAALAKPHAAPISLRLRTSTNILVRTLPSKTSRGKQRGTQDANIALKRTYGAKIKAANWREALRLLQVMRAKGVEPGVINYSCAISRCGRGGKWQRALDLLNEMRSRGLVPNEITYNSVINACAIGSASCREREQISEVAAS